MGDWVNFWYYREDWNIYTNRLGMSKPDLFHSQNPWPSSFRGLLPLVSFSESRDTCVVSTEVVKILDLVDTNDPVLARECFL